MPLEAIYVVSKGQIPQLIELSSTFTKELRTGAENIRIIQRDGVRLRVHLRHYAPK